MIGGVDANEDSQMPKATLAGIPKELIVNLIREEIRGWERRVSRSVEKCVGEIGGWIGANCWKAEDLNDRLSPMESFDVIGKLCELNNRLSFLEINHNPQDFDCEPPPFEENPVFQDDLPNFDDHGHPPPFAGNFDYHIDPSQDDNGHWYAPPPAPPYFVASDDLFMCWDCERAGYDPRHNWKQCKDDRRRRKGGWN